MINTRALYDMIYGIVILVPAILVFALMMDKKRIKQKWKWVILYVLYLNLMFIVVGIPDYSCFAWSPRLNLIPFQDFTPSNIAGMFLNVVMFIPFGVFLGIYFEYFRKKWYRTLAAGFITSLFIELVQLFAMYRTTDVDDVIMNTLGSLVGYVFVQYFFRNSEKQNGSRNDCVKLTAINVLTVLLVIFVRPVLLKIFL